MGKKQKRFVVIYEEASFSASSTILQDRATGVQYLIAGNGMGSGLTPLLNEDGTPVVGKPLSEED